MLENLRKANSIGLVFHNKGRPIANYYKAWHKACKDTSSEFPMIFAVLLSATSSARAFQNTLPC
jgi:hypothetical protein